MKFNKNHLLLHIIVLVWGFTGILGKLIELPSPVIVWYRMFFAFLSLGIFLFAARSSLLKIKIKSFLMFFGTGLIIAAHWVLFFQAIKESTVSVALACLSSASFFTALLEPLFFKRKIVAYELFFGLLVVFGLYLIFEFETEHVWGIIFAVFSALLAATFTVINGRLIKNNSSGTITLYEMLGGFAGITVYFFFSGDLNAGIFEMRGEDLIYILILGVLCTAVAFVVSVEVMKELSPFTVSISINLEPVYAILLALLFFGEEERMTAGFYAGASLILATVIVNAIIKKKRRLKTVSSESGEQ